MSSRIRKGKGRALSTSWSEWTWDPARAKYYKVRKTANGQWEVYWDEPQNKSSSLNEATPRNITTLATESYNDFGFYPPLSISKYPPKSHYLRK